MKYFQDELFPQNTHTKREIVLSKILNSGQVVFEVYNASSLHRVPHLFKYSLNSRIQI